MYIKKQVTYEAKEFSTPKNPVQFLQVDGRALHMNPDGKTGHVLVGTHTVTDGDFIVTGSDGSIEAYTKDEFNATFEELKKVE